MIQQLYSQTQTQQVQTATNHVFVVDCSGSMYGTLPRLREELKNKLTSLIGEKDKLSIIWFSGRNESDFVFDNYEVKSVTDLSNVKKGIDRWLQPQGMTAFRKPLELAVTRVDKSYLNSLVFMTDGYNNDCPTADVFKALDPVKNGFDATYFIEYGYYTDSKLIAQMAETTGGQVVMAEDFDALTVKVSEGLRGVTAPKVPFNTTEQYLFGLANGQVIVYKNDGSGVVHLAGDTEYVVWGDDCDAKNVTESLVMAYGQACLGNFDSVEKVLFKLGDTGLIETMLKAYGKQKIQSFKSLLSDTIGGIRQPFEDGINNNYVVDENAYTVLDLLNDLSQGDNLVYTNHEEFNYNRIGAKRKNVAQDANVQIAVDEVKSRMESAKSLDEINEVMQEVLDFANAVVKAPKFEPNDPNGGVNLSSLVFNSSRANISFSVQTKGKVTNLPKNDFGLTEYPSWITRAYTVCKDGILNLSKMPVSLDAATKEKLATQNLIVDFLGSINGREVFLVDFSSLPVVNKGMIKRLNSVDFVNVCLQLEEQKAAQKVYRFYNNEVNEKVTVDDPTLNEFLKEVGITYNGFNPKTTKAESTDVYFAPILDCKFAGLSSLPTIDKTIEKRVNGKSLNLADRLILKYVDLYNATMKATDNDPKTLDTLTKTIIKTKRATEFLVATNVMSLILSRGWFADKEDFDDNKVEINHPEFGLVSATLDFKDKEEKI
jgi:hypothetical protein